MTLAGQTAVIVDKPVSVSRFRPQIRHELSSDLSGPPLCEAEHTRTALLVSSFAV
jgi:hypothetical protein